MKFAHLADTHLGYRQYGLIEREGDFYNVFNEIVDKIIEERVDFIIHSGDLFEMAKPSPNALLIFQEGLMKIKEAGIPFYAVAGNHDIIMRQNALPPQILFRKLGLSLISPNNPIINSSFLKENDIFIGGIPYLPKSQNSLLKTKLQELSKKSNGFSKRILVSHQGIDKYLPFQYELELADLPDSFNYYAMGNVHNRIINDFGEGKLVYPGSTEIWRSNEVLDYKKNGKGFYIVDISGTTDRKNFEVEPIDVELPREFIFKNIEYKKLDSDLMNLERHTSSLKNKPIVNVTVEKGSFNSADVYKKLNKSLSKSTLMLRPSFKADDLIKEENQIGDKTSLEPKDLLIERLKSFDNEDISNLAIDLLNFLSKDKFEESEKISNSFYEEYFGQYEEEFKKIMKQESKNKKNKNDLHNNDKKENINKSSKNNNNSSRKDDSSEDNPIKNGPSED
ncbi:DNA double-strand break repair protein Mre11 [Candidatus Methanobinarius endosymbioticus]|uniref:DNA double-strand break repair protein Mre11 n=1 Tax=Candidatus Methanobinarius endosymbioticus TaxID=2006182 RepID=A0A366MA68_9EURY|nr:DNA double-strand break repair protein Mre11 [Candidatus Methanobinarius endosymbioticus]